MRILNAESSGYASEAREILVSVGDVVERDLDRAGLLREMPGADVVIVRLRNRIDAEVLDAAPTLRAIVTATTGLDHIDLAAAEARGVTVLSLRDETEFLRTITATAEHTWALLLALVRKIPQARTAVLGGAWDRDDFVGMQLHGKRIGIVGCGRVGTQVATFAVAFGMDVSAFDPGEIPPGVARAASLVELLEAADILSIHLPLRDETRALIGAPELAALPRGAIVVNTARGAIVDEQALVDALAAGHLAGAAVDVLGGEETGSPTAGPLVEYARTHPEVLVTPHIAGATRESMSRTEVFMARKLAAFLSEGG